MASRPAAPLGAIKARAYRIPTEEPESDGTLSWRATTLVLVAAEAGGRRGLGYTYAHRAAAVLVNDVLAEGLSGREALNLPELWAAMTGRLRNLGDSGLTRLAAAGLDNALWDLKAKLLDLPLVDLLGAARSEVAAYGSGGFTSYDAAHLSRQLQGWAEAGFGRVKMKIGRDPAADPGRVRLAREAVGPGVELFVDANGGYGPRQALAMAERLASWGVSWFEEPVPHQDLDGLAFVRQRTPAAMEIACGEYGFDLAYFRRMIEAKAVDVLQADATRCGITGFLAAANLCQAHNLPLSAHCAPALHVHLGCACPALRHLEYFHDHARIEALLFDGAPRPRGGRLAPDRGRPGLGLDWKEEDARQFEL